MFYLITILNENFSTHMNKVTMREWFSRSGAKWAIYTVDVEHCFLLELKKVLHGLLWFNPKRSKAGKFCEQKRTTQNTHTALSTHGELQSLCDKFQFILILIHNRDVAHWKKHLCKIPIRSKWDIFLLPQSSLIH